jgi:hypothetical protein
MVFTLFAVQNAKPREQSYILTDGNGLVSPSGGKLWRLRYRFGGKQNMLPLGAFPEVTIASARQKRDDARRLLAQGIDPSQRRKDQKRAVLTAAQNTFGAIAAEYLAKLEAEGKAGPTLDKNRWLLEGLAAPLSKRPITDITPAELLDLLRTVQKSGRRETAKRLRGTIGSVFRFAIQTLRAETDPTFALRGALLKPEVTHRPAITDEKKTRRGDVLHRRVRWLANDSQCALALGSDHDPTR